MRRSLNPLATLVVALACAMLFLVLATAPAPADGNPSSRVAGRAGTLAMHDWLAALGFSTHRISGDFSTRGTDVMFIIDPSVAFSDIDIATLMRFLGSGGDVVLAISPLGAPLVSPLLARLHVSLGTPRVAGDSAPAQPIDAGDRVHHVPMGAGVSIAVAPNLAPILVQGNTVTAVVQAVPGGGRAYVVASPFPFSNDGLRDGDSAGFVLALLTRAHGGALAFDEYHHGEQTGTASGAFAIFIGPVGLALLLGVFAVVAYLALSGRRLGPPVPPGDPGLVPTTASYIDAMAGLYSRSRDRAAVAERYAQELKLRIGGQAGVDPALDDDAFVAAVQSLRPSDAAALRAALSRARKLAATTPDAAALLALARDVDDLETTWARPPAAVSTAQ